jgi:hypothetical protein
VVVAVAAVATDGMALYWPVEFPAAAGAGRPPVSSGQEVSTATPETLGDDLGDQDVEAAAAAAPRWNLGPARGRCSTAPRWNRPELAPESGERRQAGETGAPCRRRCTDALHLLRC